MIENHDAVDPSQYTVIDYSADKMLPFIQQQADFGFPTVVEAHVGNTRLPVKDAAALCQLAWQNYATEMSRGLSPVGRRDVVDLQRIEHELRIAAERITHYENIINPPPEFTDTQPAEYAEQGNIYTFQPATLPNAA